MNQVYRFQTLEKDKLVVPLTNAGTMDEGADVRQQISLVSVNSKIGLRAKGYSPM